MASFSVPIINKDKLWGLVACHSLTPKHISLEKRNICKILTQSFTIGILNYKASQRFEKIESIDKKIENFLQNVFESDKLIDGVIAHSEKFLDIISASGVAMLSSGEILSIGECPSLDFIAKLDEWFINVATKEVYFETESILGSIGISEKSACGVVCLKIKTIKSDLIRFYWFRPEIIQEITWAGNPNKPIAEDTNAKALSPRMSFDKWVEISTDRSDQWDKTTKMVALKLRSQLLRWL
jgi:light-regulated signal transduction histidine kinase (bacteriophytochrome)